MIVTQLTAALLLSRIEYVLVPQRDVLPVLSGIVVKVLAVFVYPTLSVTALIVTPETSRVLLGQGFVSVKVKSRSDVAVPAEERVTLTRRLTLPLERLTPS